MAKEKHKLAIGVAIGPSLTTHAKWWGPAMATAAHLDKIGVEFHGVLHAGSMMVDGNRNNVTTGFLESAAEWLLWIDTDTVFKVGAIKRLFDINKTLTSGVYVGKAMPFNNIAFRRLSNGRYVPVSEFEDYYKGEIIPIDMAGLGFCLTHRSVYEDMKKVFDVYQDNRGHYWVIHKDDVTGEIKPGKKHAYDDKVRQGQLRVRLNPLDHELMFWPWFQMNHGRTEDVPFFENAARAGHKAWLDTSLTAKHFGLYDFTDDDRIIDENIKYARFKIDRHPRNYEVNYGHVDPNDWRD